MDDNDIASSKGKNFESSFDRLGRPRVQECSELSKAAIELSCACPRCNLTEQGKALSKRLYKYRIMTIILSRKPVTKDKTRRETERKRNTSVQLSNEKVQSRFSLLQAWPSPNIRSPRWDGGDGETVNG